MPNKKLIALGSLLLALGVGLGAFGAHGLESILIENSRVDTYNTAVLYHFIHGIGIMLAGTLKMKNANITVLLFTVGIVCFSGSLYTLSLTNTVWLGAVAPIGGMAFIIGWISLAWQAYKK